MTDQEIIRAVAENWVVILPGYEVSNLGRVRSWRHKNGFRKTPIIMKQNNIGRYFMVQFWINGKGYNYLVHNLVLTAFVGPRPEGMQACHNDGNGFNNNIDNLRWDTCTNNHKDKIRHGTMARGSKQGNSKLTEEKVETIKLWREMYGYSYKKLGELHDVDKTTIYKIFKGITWRHI